MNAEEFRKMMEHVEILKKVGEKAEEQREVMEQLKSTILECMADLIFLQAKTVCEVIKDPLDEAHLYMGLETSTKDVASWLTALPTKTEIFRRLLSRLEEARRSESA